MVEDEYDGDADADLDRGDRRQGPAGAGAWRCPASASRRRRSSSPCSPSSSAYAPRAGSRPSARYAEDGYRSVADVVDPALAAEGARLQEGRRRPRPRRRPSDLPTRAPLVRRLAAGRRVPSSSRRGVTGRCRQRRAARSRLTRPGLHGVRALLRLTADARPSTVSRLQASAARRRASPSGSLAELRAGCRRRRHGRAPRLGGGTTWRRDQLGRASASASTREPAAVARAAGRRPATRASQRPLPRPAVGLTTRVPGQSARLEPRRRRRGRATTSRRSSGHRGRRDARCTRSTSRSSTRRRLRRGRRHVRRVDAERTARRSRDARPCARRASHGRSAYRADRGRAWASSIGRRRRAADVGATTAPSARRVDVVDAQCGDGVDRSPVPTQARTEAHWRGLAGRPCRRSPRRVERFDAHEPIDAVMAPRRATRCDAGHGGAGCGILTGAWQNERRGS